MPPVQGAQPMLCLAAGLVAGLATGGFLAARMRQDGLRGAGEPGDHLIAILISLAAFGLVAYLAYILI